MTKTQNPEAQTQALAEFKAQAKLLERDKEDDEACCRFLRARQYNVDKAVEIYAKWRAENSVDTVLDSPFAVDKTLWRHSFHGRDKAGRPLFIEPTGILDIKTIIKEGYTMDTLVRAHIYQQEYMARLTEEASKKEGRSIEQTLSDLEGAGVWMHLNGSAREFFSILAGIAQNYYPERLYKLIVVNAPRAFPMAWSFIKPFLDVHTQNKIIIPHHKDQLKVLLEHVDACFIPEKFGGTCKCEARGCFTGPNPTVFVDALRYDEGNLQSTHTTTTTTTTTTEKEETTEEEEEEEEEEEGEKEGANDNEQVHHDQVDDKAEGKKNKKKNKNKNKKKK